MALKSTHKLNQFAREWVIDQNGTRAAQAVGIADSWAHVYASEALKKPKVKRLIAQLQAKRLSKLELKADKVLEELVRLAFSNMHDFTRVDGDGKPVLDLSSIDRDKFAAVQEIREDTTGGSGDGERKVVVRTTIKLSDKTKALDMLMRHLGQYNDKLDVTVTEGLAERIAEGRQRKLERAGNSIS